MRLRAILDWLTSGYVISVFLYCHIYSEEKLILLSLRTPLLDGQGNDPMHEHTDATSLLRADTYATHTGDAEVFIDLTEVIRRNGSNRAFGSTLSAAAA